MREEKDMAPPSEALRLLTVEVDSLVQAIGEAAASSATSYVEALAARGYVPVPIPWEDGPVARGGKTDLLILGRNETAVPLPSASLLRAVAFMENAFQIGRAIGEPGEAQKERIVDLADSLERLTPAERSILGAHYHYMLRTPEFRARPLDLWKHDVPSRYRIVKSLYVAVSADGTLYDVIVEQLEMLLDNEGMDGRRTVSGLIPARQVVLRYARPEYGPEKWTGLAPEDAQLLSWIAARPRANMSDLEARARQLGLESHEALLRIKKWVETEPALGAGDRRRLSVPSPDQRP